MDRAFWLLVAVVVLVAGCSDGIAMQDAHGPGFALQVPANWKTYGQGEPDGELLVAVPPEAVAEEPTGPGLPRLDPGQGTFLRVTVRRSEFQWDSFDRYLDRVTSRLGAPTELTQVEVSGAAEARAYRTEETYFGPDSGVEGIPMDRYHVDAYHPETRHVYQLVITTGPNASSNMIDAITATFMLTDVPT